MKSKTRRAISLIVALLVAVLMTVGYVFAWLVDRVQSELIISGTSAGAYFDSGNGSQETPFIIANPTHMHNLAVLQNTGKFVDRDGNPKKYYFEIKESVDTIDMSGHYIPPIGNDKNPFIGDFNGKGKTLANLNVTTDKTLLKDEYPAHAKSDYEFSQAVGLFGMTGESSDIHNVILENPSVDVSAVNTLYSATKNAAVGLAIGFVAGKCSSIGVRAVGGGSALNVNVSGYSTFNSILGALGENVTSSVTGGGHTSGSGGSGSSFGANFDMASVLDRLYKIVEGKYGIKREDYKQDSTDSKVPLANSSPELPQISFKNGHPTPAAGAKIAFTVKNSNTLDYSASDAAEEISDQNIGYFLGNENKFDTKNFTFLERMTNPNNGWTDWRTSVGASGTKVPAWFYTYDVKTGDRSGNGCYSDEGFRELSDAEFEELPDGIKSILGDVGTQKNFATLRISQDAVTTGNWGQATAKQQWSYHGQISWRGNVYGTGFKSVDGYAVDEDGNYYKNQYGGNIPFNEYSGGIALPNNAIWFKPAQAGKFRFVMYSQSDKDGFILNKLIRNNASADEPFKVDPSEYGSDVKMEIILQQNLPAGVLFYFDYDVSETEYAAGNVEFMLQKHSDGGAHFVYLDIGASAADDTSGIDREKAVSAVDFIYDGVEIRQGDPSADAADAVIKVGDFIVHTSGGAEAFERYESSKTSVYFDDLKAVLNLVFLRLYSGSTDHADKTKTICLEKSDPVPDKNSEVHATFAAYVCPAISGGSGTVSGGNTGTVTPTPDPDPAPNPDSGTYGFTHGGTNGDKWSSTSTDTSSTTDNAYTGTKLSNSTYVILSAGGTKATVSLKGFTRSTSSAVNVIVEFLDSDGAVLGSLTGVTLANKEYGDITLTESVFESSTPFASVRIYCADASRTFALVSANIIIE